MRKVIDITARFSFSFVLVFFGLNQFFHFFPNSNYPNEAQQLIDAFQISGYIFYTVGTVQVMLGIMLLINRYVALGLVLFAPVLVNVLLFHLCMDLAGLPKVLPTLLLYTYFIFRYKHLFVSLLKNLCA